jgi:hypothetical protein
MNLAGSLSAFALPDVLTLLASTGKSGRLTMMRVTEGERGAGFVRFDGGRIVGASGDERRSARLRRLTGYGDDAFWQGIGALAGESAIAAELVAGGWVGPDVLLAISRETTLDAVIELLHWPTGQFEFELGATDDDDPGVRVDRELGADLSVPDVLAEAQRRDGSRPGASACEPEPNDLLALPLAIQVDASITRDEWALLALVDGARTALEVAELRGREVGTVLAEFGDLISKGYLVVAVDGASPVAELRHRLHEITAIEHRAVADRSANRGETADREANGGTLAASRPTLTLAPESAAKDPKVSAAKNREYDEPWTPTDALTELAVPVDRDAVMRLIVGVQGL